MKILLVTHTFLPHYVGGTEVYTYQLANEFSKTHAVSIFSSDPLSHTNNYKIIETLYKNLNVFYLKKNISRYRTFETNYNDEKVIRPFKHLIKTLKPDIIHYQHLMHLSVNLIKIGKSFGIPSVLTLNDFWFQTMLFNRITSQNKLILHYSDEEATKDLANLFRLQFYISTRQRRFKHLNFLKYCFRFLKKIYNKLLFNITFEANKDIYFEMVRQRSNLMRKNLALADMVIFPTLFLFQEFCQWGIKVKKSIISSHGVNVGLFNNFKRSKSNHLRFGFIGSIIPAKGLDVLLKAWIKVAKPSVQLNIYGDLKTDKKYAKKIMDLSKKVTRVFFKGPFPSNKIADVFSEIDVLIIPSRWFENAPLVLRNALLSKTPVIATNLGSLPELIKEKNSGLLFENEDTDDLSDKINFIINNPKVLESFKFPKQKTIEENAQELTDIYTQLIKIKHEK